MSSREGQAHRACQPGLWPPHPGPRPHLTQEPENLGQETVGAGKVWQTQEAEKREGSVPGVGEGQREERGGREALWLLRFGCLGR